MCFVSTYEVSCIHPHVNIFQGSKTSVITFPLLRITIRHEGYTVFDKTREGRDGAAKSPKLSSSPPLLWSSSLSSGRVYRCVRDRRCLKFQAFPLTKPHIEVSSRDWFPTSTWTKALMGAGGSRVRSKHWHARHAWTRVEFVFSVRNVCWQNSCVRTAMGESECSFSSAGDKSTVDGN